MNKDISYIYYRFPLDQFRIQGHMSHTGRARKAQRKQCGAFARNGFGILAHGGKPGKHIARKRNTVKPHDGNVPRDGAAVVCERTRRADGHDIRHGKHGGAAKTLRERSAHGRMGRGE
jgi:hypothetical protein